MLNYSKIKRSLLNFDQKLWKIYLKSLKNGQREGFKVFLSSLEEFRLLGGHVNNYYPILDEFDQAAGTADSDYFHQDLIVAQEIYSRNPASHFDIGGRIDGFVAHVASFREIQVLDIRQLQNTSHPNIRFRQIDFFLEDLSEITDSVSCLHTIEHFGLGRYGDKLNPQGHKDGFKKLLGMLKPGGILYVSFPISNSATLAFNAHRILEPRELLDWLPSEFNLVNFHFVNDSSELVRDWDLASKLPQVKLGCGIYIVQRKSSL